MSVKLMSQAWDMPIPQGQKMVLLALCDHANDDGICYPSQDKLAQKCSMSNRAIINHIKWLMEHGILSKERRQSTQRRKSDLYEINLSGFTAPANSAPANSAPAQFSPEPANSARSEPENFAGSYIRKEPSVDNHQLEPSESGGVSDDNTATADDVIDVDCVEVLDKPTAKRKKLSSADKDAKIRANPDNVATWNAYAKAYRARYDVVPTSNQRTRGQIAQFVKLVGAENAPKLAEYYVWHNDNWFVKHRHDLGNLLKSYQQITTDFARNEQMTTTKARQTEQTQSNFDVMNAVLAKRQAQRNQQGN